MKESKEDRFCRVAEARVNKIIKMMRLLGNCSNNAVYAFSPEQVEQIFETLQFELNREDILLTPRDIYNMSKELGMRPGDFFHAYCEYYIGSNSRMPIVRLKPRGSVQRCPLLKDRKCSVHKAKPVVCAMFPIGRGIRTEGDVEKNPLSECEIEYIFNDPRCGDNSETHTVREWLTEFGISIDDKFFLKWSNIIRELGSVFRKAEGKLKNSLMENIWTLTFVKLYLAYDMEKDFLPQFEDNSEDLLALMQFMPIPKGGEK